MFGSIGMSELILIAAIALMVLGPEKFPEFAKIAARAWRDVRSYLQEAQTELAKEIRPVQNELRQLSRMDPESYIDRLTGETAKKDESKPPATDPEDVYGYNPEPEGPEIDGTFRYDSFAKSERPVGNEEKPPETPPDPELAKAGVDDGGEGPFLDANHTTKAEFPERMDG